jgi:hypothetical protein
MEAVKKQTKLEKVKAILIKRQKRLESSLKFFMEELEKSDNYSTRSAREYLIEITGARLEEITGVLELIDLKYPFDGEYSFVDKDVLYRLNEKR